jgi:hypothetical protein
MDGCREMAISHLRPLMDRMFENADVALLGFAEKAESNSAQAVFFEAMTEVRKKRGAIEQRFLGEIDRSFREFPLRCDQQTEADESPDAFGGLSLVDREEMDTSVAMLNASNKLATRIMDRIFGLKQRLAIANDGTAIEEAEIPAGPSWLGSAYRQAIEELELETKIRLVFIVLFEKFVLSNVEALFDEFNQRLIKHGILPNLRYEVRKQPGGVEIVATTAPEDSETEAPAHDPDADESTGSDHSPAALGDELFGRICDLIAVRRGAPTGRRGDDGAPGAPAAGGGYAADQGAGSAGGGPAGAPAGAVLVSEISRMQALAQSATTRLSTSELIEDIEVDDGLVERLQDTLSAEREKIFGGIDRRTVPAADTNVIELVGMLFEYMLQEESIPNVVKALLSRMHTPLLKVAVVDRQFFTRSQHPARKLLNDMTAAGKRWVDEGAIERGIFPKMKEIVDRTLIEFEEDVGIFDLLLEDFEKAMQELRQRADLVEQRNAEAADGQDKLHAARARAQEELASLCAGKAVAEVAHNFLQRLWADKLTFILLRNADGDTSADWKSAAALARRMIDSLLPPASEAAQQQRRQALGALQQELREQTRMMQQVDKEKLLLQLFDLQAQTLENVVTEPAPVASKAATAAENTVQVGVEAEPDTGATTPEPSAEPEQSPLSEAQKAALEQLNNIPFGTWFEFDMVDKATQRAKLSWRSTITEKFMFVDGMGVKAVVISMRDLAESVSNGTARIIKEEKKPFVDRALDAIHGMLDRTTRQKAEA